MLTALLMRDNCSPSSLDRTRFKHPGFVSHRLLRPSRWPRHDAQPLPDEYHCKQSHLKSTETCDTRARSTSRVPSASSVELACLTPEIEEGQTCMWLQWKASVNVRAPGEEYPSSFVIPASPYPLAKKPLGYCVSTPSFLPGAAPRPRTAGESEGNKGSRDGRASGEVQRDSGAQVRPAHRPRDGGQGLFGRFPASPVALTASEPSAVLPRFLATAPRDTRF